MYAVVIVNSPSITMPTRCCPLYRLTTPSTPIKGPSMTRTIWPTLNLGTSTILTKRAKGSIVINSEVMKGTTYDIILPIEKEINE